MSISKAILNAGERMSPLLKKCIPQSMLSRIKAGVLNREAENIGSVHIRRFARSEFPDGMNLIGDIRVDTCLGQSMRYVSEILYNAWVPNLIYNYYVPP